MQVTDIQIEHEIRRRMEEEGAELYSPHSEQERFHRCAAPIRGIFTGNQFGKTYAGAMETFWHVAKTHPYLPPITEGAVNARACCVDFPTTQKVLIPTFQKLIPRRLLKGGSWEKAWSEKERTITFTSDYPILGGTIELMSYDQGRKRYQGAVRHLIWEDEEAPQDIHLENIARTLTVPDPKIILTMTPIEPSMWIVTEIFERAPYDENIVIFTGNSKDNPYVNPKSLEIFINSIKDPAERAARLSGEPMWRVGRIYKNYGGPNRLEWFQIPPDWPRVVAIDTHRTKETAVVFAAWSPFGELYCYEEIWVGGPVKRIAARIRQKLGSQMVHLWLIDPSSDVDEKTQNTTSIFQKFSENFPDVLKWNNDPNTVWQQIEEVRDYIQVVPETGFPKLYVMNEACPITDWQLEHYTTKPKNKADAVRYKPEPIKVKEDFCDAVRAIIDAGPVRRMAYSRRAPRNEDRFDMGGYE